MKNLFKFILLMTFFFSTIVHSYDAVVIENCDATVSASPTTIGDPPTDHEAWILNNGDGIYTYRGLTIGATYADYMRQGYPDWTYSIANPPAPDGWSYNLCVKDGITDTSKACQFIQANQLYSCPTGYSVQKDSWGDAYCQLEDIAACEAALPVVCNDGFEENLLGYPGCDRPDLKFCPYDETYVRADTGICEVPCTDFTSCKEFAESESTCGDNQTFDFNYTNPENWDYSCTSIISTSPDHIDNGGNADGNELNDPLSPTYTNVADSDTQTVSESIGDELTDDLSSIERAIRESIDQIKVSTNTLESGASSNTGILDTTLTTGFGSLETAIGNNTTSLQASLDSLEAAVTALEDDSLEPSHTVSTNTYSGTGSLFSQALNQTDVVVAFNNFKTPITLSTPICPILGFTLPSPINEYVSTDLHCTLYAQISTYLTTIMLIIYSFTGFRIITSA